jgi:DNA polymerase-1
MVAEGGVSDFRDIIEDMNITKYGYDLKAQRNLLERNGIIMEGKYMDIELMHYLVNPEKSHKLEILAKTYLDINLEESMPQQESAPSPFSTSLRKRKNRADSLKQQRQPCWEERFGTRWENSGCRNFMTRWKNLC